MDSVRVSACIVTYNNRDTIVKTVESILRQTKGIPFQLYIVDNQSIDGTKQLIREKFPEVVLLENKKNLGYGAGHNTVLPLLESEYHVIINPDIELRQDAISEIVRFFEENPDVGMVSPRVCHEDGNAQILGKRDPTLRYLLASRFRGKRKLRKSLREYAMLDAQGDTVHDIENATGCFMMLRTSIFRRIGGFDEKFFLYFEDSDLTRRARALQRVVYNPHVVVYHRWNRGSKRSLHLMWLHMRSMIYYFAKWR